MLSLITAQAPSSHQMLDAFAEAKTKLVEEMASLGNVAKPEIEPQDGPKPEPQHLETERQTPQGSKQDEDAQKPVIQAEAIPENQDQGIQPAQPPATGDSIGLVLKIAYRRICDNGETPRHVLNSWADEDSDNATNWLKAHYDNGKHAKNLAADVITGLREGAFDTKGDGAFAMVAYLHGASNGISFNVLDVLGGTQKQ